MLRHVSIAAALAAAAAFGQMGADAPDRPIDAAARHAIVEKAAEKVDAFYVYPDVGAKIAAHLRQRDKQGAYNQITSSAEFARALTDDLRSVNHDLHLRVFYGGEHARPPQTIEGLDHMRAMVGPLNYGFEKAERLAGNVGYLEIRGFYPREVGQDTAAAAMAFLANTDALIIDIRRNPGGEGTMVAFVCSYLFGDKPVHINDYYWRRSGRTEQSWTDPHVPGRRYGDKPVYVLTSRHTFSAAEEFAYDLQQQKRATLVGDATGGGAHPGEVQELGNFFNKFAAT